MKKFLVAAGLFISAMVLTPNAHAVTQESDEARIAKAVVAAIVDAKRTPDDEKRVTSALPQKTESVPQEPAVDKATKWVKLGQQIGQVTLSAAKEVGMGVAEFAATPLGVIVTGIIVWKVVSKDIAQLIAGSIIMYVGLSTANRILNARMGDVQITYRPILGGLFRRKEKVVTRYCDMDFEDYVLPLAVGAFSMLFSGLVGFAH